jgi:hypothetical protein
MQRYITNKMRDNSAMISCLNSGLKIFENVFRLSRSTKFLKSPELRHGYVICF